MALEIDADRRLALAYVPAARRAAVEALWRLDLAFASVLTTGREPLISQIRLSWWRESLEKLDHAPAPSEPVLQAVAAEVVARGVTGADLAEMEDGWLALLEPTLTKAEIDRYAKGRGGLLFRHSAILLGGEPTHEIEAAGECWALTDLARHSANEADAAASLAAARERVLLRHWSRELRPLGMLAALAARDAASATWEQQGSPGRMLRMFRHRLTGR